MKCVCRYENEVDETGEALDNNEPFIRLLGSDTHFEISKPKTLFGRIRVELYACPKCGTIRMEI